MFRYKLGMNEEKSSLVNGYYVEFRYKNSVEMIYYYMVNFWKNSNV